MHSTCTCIYMCPCILLYPSVGEVRYSYYNNIFIHALYMYIVVCGEDTETDMLERSTKHMCQFEPPYTHCMFISHSRHTVYTVVSLSSGHKAPLLWPWISVIKLTTLCVWSCKSSMCSRCVMRLYTCIYCLTVFLGWQLGLSKNVFEVPLYAPAPLEWLPSWLCALLMSV